MGVSVSHSALRIPKPPVRFLPICVIPTVPINDLIAPTGRLYPALVCAIRPRTRHFPDLPAMHGSPPAARSDITPAHARAEKDSFVELDRHPQISLLEGGEWAEGVRIVDRELTS
jgi:hypothetical protein